MRVIGQGIARKNRADPRIDRDDQGVARKSSRVQTPPLIGSGDRDDLGGTQDLPESPILAEKVGPLASAINARYFDRPTRRETDSLRMKGGMRPGFAIVRRSKKFLASKAALRTNSKADP